VRLHPGPRAGTTILGAATLLALAMGDGSSPRQFKLVPPPAVVTGSGLAGLWRSTDGAVRLALEPDGTYERSVTGRRKATRGTYRVEGTTVLLQDDSGLRTTVTSFDDTLEMAGHRLFRD